MYWINNIRCKVDGSCVYVIDKRVCTAIIANFTPNNQIDKNTTTFCQKHSGFTFAGCWDGNTPKLLVWLITLREREREVTLAVYYTSPQSPIITFSYSLA